MSDEGVAELEKIEELLHIYMDLCEEQEEAISKMSRIIKLQNEKIKHMKNAYDFIDIQGG